MTEDERKAYFKLQKAKRDADGPFAELVKGRNLDKGTGRRHRQGATGI